MDVGTVANSTARVLEFPAINEKLKKCIMDTDLYANAPMLEEDEWKNSVRFFSPVSTNNWDTVTVVRVSELNRAIEKQGTYPKEIDYTVFDDSLNGKKYQIQGKFQPWAITTGGDGRNIWFRIRFESGTFCNGDEQADIPNGAEITISVSLAYFPLPQQPASNGKYNLSVDTNSSELSQCVLVLNVDTHKAFSPILESVFASVLKQWFNLPETLKEFQPLFATVVIDNQGSKDFAWLHPTYMSYAYRDARDIGEALFGVLCMTNNRDSGEGIKQLPLVSMKKDENILYLLNREVFVKYQYLPSLPLAIPGTTADNYTLGRDGISITAKEIGLSKVTYGAIDYHPVLRNFIVSFDEERVRTELLVDVNISPGIDVHSYVETEHTFALGYNGDNKPIMVYKNIGEPIVRNETDVSPGIVVTEAILDIILAVVSAGLSEAVNKVLYKVIIAFIAALVAAVIGVVIHEIIENVVKDGVLDKVPSVTPMLEAAIDPVKWPFLKTEDINITEITYSGAFIFAGKVGTV